MNIDPPYNTGKDFIYKDDFHDSLENYKKITGQVDGNGKAISTNAETSGRYHTDWLNMMYPRLRLARNLLADDGVIFISIDDNEVHNLKKICDEVFGESNYLVEFSRVTKRGGKSSDVTAKNHDYILLYSRNATLVDLAGVPHDDSGYNNQDEFLEERGYYKLNQTLDYNSLGYSRSLDYPIELDGEIFYPGGDIDLYNNRQNGLHSRADWAWRWSKELFMFGYDNGFIEVRRGGIRPRIYTKTYQKVKIKDISGKYAVVDIDRTKPLSTLEFTENKYSNDNAKKVFDKLMGNNIFEYTKPPVLIGQLLKLIDNKVFITLDFFSGSSTTAHAVMQLNAEDGGNRKFIMVQLPEPTDEKSEAYRAGYMNISEIGKERIRRAGEKIKKEKGLEAQNLDIGFKVLKLDTSNIRKWQPDYDNLEQSLLDYVDNYAEGRTELDVVYEIILKYGLDLTYSVNEYTIAQKKVYSIGFGMLMICLDNEITTEVAKGIIEKVKELKPEENTRVVFKDNGFKTDSNKTNVKEILKSAGIEEFITL
ncbi:MAG: site-specific DNA-methyltransferase [Firmicutes bacterium]|nr:site-specific DNA-methyltransferase [Bacillota bacterium]